MTCIKYSKAVLKYEDEDVYVELDVRVLPANKDCDVSAIYTYDEWRTPRSKNGSFLKNTSSDESLYRISIFVSHIPRNSRVWFALKLVDHKTCNNENGVWDNNGGINYEIVPEKLPQICLPSKEATRQQTLSPIPPSHPPTEAPSQPQTSSRPSSPISRSSPQAPSNTNTLRPSQPRPQVKPATPHTQSHSRSLVTPTQPTLPIPQTKSSQNHLSAHSFQHIQLPSFNFPQQQSHSAQHNNQPPARPSMKSCTGQMSHLSNAFVSSKPPAASILSQPTQTAPKALTPQQLFNLQRKYARFTPSLPVQKPTPSHVVIPSDFFPSHSICNMMQGHRRIYDEYIC